MAKIWTVEPGVVIEVGHYGPASNDRAATVPEGVAQEFVNDERFRVEVGEAVVGITHVVSYIGNEKLYDAIVNRGLTEHEHETEPVTPAEGAK